jgi:6-phosphofructokinase 1
MKKIGIVTAGGDAPGMNAIIRSVVRSAIHNGLQVIGFERGYAGLIDGQMRKMGPRSVSGIINLGGSILRTVRCQQMKTNEGIRKASAVLWKNGIEGFITIGGDGTLMGASKLHKDCSIPIIGIPATIDNDVAGTDTTVGFDTAVNTAIVAIDKIRDTATSHERIFVVEVMGRKRGFLALEVGLCGGAEVILVPEIEFNLEQICETLIRGRKEGKTSEIIVIAEGAGNSREIVEHLMENTKYQVRLTVLGYIQRGGPPTAISRALASEFGHHAVELLLTGETKRTVGISNGEVGSIDLDRSWSETRKFDLKRYKLAKVLSQ